MTDENDEWKGKDNDDDDDDDNDNDDSPNLYSLLNLSRDASEEEIHRSYRSLSTTFHPDKVLGQLPTTLSENDELGSILHDLDISEIQETFLKFKKAHDVLIDPVMRLAYDFHGDYGVELIRRVQQQQRDQKTRRDQKNGNSGGDDDTEDDNDGANEDDDDDDDGDLYNLYETLEDLLVVQKKFRKAKAELDRFMEQHDYQQNLAEGNYVHLNLSMTFPPSIPLTPILYQGRDYLRYVQKHAAKNPLKDEDEREYFKQRILQEKRLIDYQVNHLRSSQKADLGFTLSSVQPPRQTTNNSNSSNQGNQRQLQPSRWSMAIGCNTDLVYPGVEEIANMAKAAENKKKQQQQQPQNSRKENVVEVDDQQEPPKHPVSAFVNTNYTPNAQTQVFWTANLNNDNESHQYSFGSTHSFSNQTACRYGMTYLARSPFPNEEPIIFNLKTYRHLQQIGTASVGVSASSSGQMLQWNAKWETTKISKKFYNFVHKLSVKANIGMLQGNSLEFGYNCKLPKPEMNYQPSQNTNNNSNRKKNNQLNAYQWLNATISIPRNIEITTVLGGFYKVSAMVTHEIASLATNPTLGFGMEHQISLGRWAWIWEIQYNGSTFRIPIPIIQLGSMRQGYYSQKFFHGIYCLFLQSMIADLLDSDDDGDRKPHRSESGAWNDENKELVTNVGSNVTVVVKTKTDAEKQLALMKPIAEDKTCSEAQRPGGGLVILRATYWQKFTQNAYSNDDDDESHSDDDDDSVHEIVSMDATIQLQFWVNNSRLSIPSKLPKSSLLGFHSLHIESKLLRSNFQDKTPKRWWSYGRQWIRNLTKRWRTTKGKNQNSSSEDCWHDPQLTVRYSFNGSVYEITVGDTESLVLPCEDGAAEQLGDANFVQ